MQELLLLLSKRCFRVGIGTEPLVGMRRLGSRIVEEKVTDIHDGEAGRRVETKSQLRS